MALRTQEEGARENDENSAPAQATKATVKMATELNEISGNIQEKEKMYHTGGRGPAWTP